MNPNLPDTSRFDIGYVIRFPVSPKIPIGEPTPERGTLIWEHYRVAITPNGYKYWEQFTPHPTYSAYFEVGTRPNAIIAAIPFEEVES
jgi:hypothetical protein